MTSCHPGRERPAFRVAPVGWPKRTIFGNLSSFIRWTWPSNLYLSFTVTLESGIEPLFSYNLLFEIRSVSQVPRTICRQFIWKLVKILGPEFRNCISASFKALHLHFSDLISQLWKRTLQVSYFIVLANCPRESRFSL